MPDLEKFLEELAALARQMNRYVSAIDMEKSEKALKELKKAYLSMGGRIPSEDEDPLFVWMEMIKYETYLPQQLRHDLAPFRQLVEFGLSGFMRNFKVLLKEILVELFHGENNRRDQRR